MAWFLAERQSRTTVMVYLALAVLVTCYFEAADTLCSSDFGEQSHSDYFFDSVVTAVDCLATEQTFTVKGGKYSRSPLRMGSLWVITPFGAYHIGTALVQSLFKTDINIHHITLKKAALLKLLV